VRCTNGLSILVAGLLGSPTTSWGPPDFFRDDRGRWDNYQDFFWGGVGPGPNSGSGGRSESMNGLLWVGARSDVAETWQKGSQWSPEEGPSFTFWARHRLLAGWRHDDSRSRDEGRIGLQRTWARPGPGNYLMERVLNSIVMISDKNYMGQTWPQAVTSVVGMVNDKTTMMSCGKIKTVMR